MHANTIRIAIAAACAGIGWMALAQRAPMKTQTMKLGPYDVLPLETQVLGHSRWLKGGPAALRVIVSDHRTGRPVPSRVRIALAPAAKAGAAAAELFDGRTNALGTLDARFTAPSSEPGPYNLRVQVDSPLGKDEVAQQIRLESAERILLTCDKPVYQPGQIIHLRALALDLANRRAVSGQPITFEVEDARGNKVFKKKEALSRFGVAGVDFQLADEVNMGTFTLRAILPTGQEEKKVRVERYVLPKFKVAVTTERPYYLPGELVKGTVQADYFFGKPVAGGKVSVIVNTLDIGVTKLAELSGTTDASGTWKFEYQLPNAFVGQPFEQGKAVAEFQARVTDTADHQQLQSLSVPVVKDPILVALVPESRQPVPGIENRVYIACATPDGSPVRDAEVTVSTSQGRDPAKVTTDSLGMATFAFTPRAGDVTVSVRVAGTDGHSATASLLLSAAPMEDGVILRTDKTLANVGDALQLTAVSSVKSGTIYVDVIRNKQTILTRAEAARNGRADLRIPLTPDMAGTLEIHAYKILPSEQIVRDTRTVVVSPANDLTITVTTDRPEYRPGQEALLRFAVRDQARRPVAAAIALAVVDESVFALSEMQPGLEKVYFMLERELMEPKYEIHGLRPSDLVLRRGLEVAEPQRQRAAALILAAAPAAPEFDFRTNTYQVRWMAVRQKVAQVMLQALQRIQRAAQKHRQDTGASLPAETGLQTLVDKRYLRPGDILDPWGRPYQVETFGNGTLDGYFSLKSAGPDGRWGTTDDVRGPGGLGGAAFGVMEEALPFARDGVRFDMAMAPPAAEGAVFKDRLAAPAAPARSQNGSAAEPRVRQYFPETMYWNPELVTDDQGRAELKLSMADSITTWRMTMLANSAAGQLGSATAPIKVFQDFFVDIDLPVSLTQNDRVEIPVAVYNYLPGEQEVSLTLEEQPWFKLEGAAKRSVRMARNEVKVVHFPLTVTSLGRHSLKVVARGTKLSDAIQRAIDVTPDGREVRGAINDRLEKQVEKTVAFPGNAIPGATSLWVKLYPGAFSTVVEGLDGILRMPNGCFEQTSSATYPNILVTDYLRATKKINPELQMKAEQYINVGYQRLVTFECKGGGFSWFGNEPAHQILTAYGLMEFADMARVHDVDAALISRTQQWLAGRQKPDGTWPEDAQGIAEGIINRQTGALRRTAYIGWALAESGFQGPAVGKAVEYVKAHRGEAKDPYTLAVILNLLARVEKDGEAAANVANQLIGMAKQNANSAWWEGSTQTFTGAKAESADLETTGLATYGLARWGRNAGFVNKALTYLVQSKDSFGTWQTTQGTVWAMKALLFASSNGVGGGQGTVTVWANGAKAATIKITPEDSDVMRQIDLREHLKAERNEVKLVYEGEGSLLYQIASRHYVPWGAQVPVEGPLSIKVEYDKTTLAQDDTATVTATVRNLTDKVAEMPLIDLGVPPGFTVDPELLEEAVKAKRISKYTLAARQIIVYLEKLDPRSTVEIRFRIKARFPIRARTPLSRAYPYYNPEQAAVSPPRQLVVSR